MSTFILAVSTAVFFTTLYSLIKFTDYLSVIKTIAGSIVIKAVDLLKYLFEILMRAGSIVLSLVKALWALVTAYPLPFATVTIVTFLLLMILVKLINSYQRENYA